MTMGHDGRVSRILTSTTQVTCTYSEGVQGVTVDQLRQFVMALQGVPGEAFVKTRVAGKSGAEYALSLRVAHDIPERVVGGQVVGEL